MLLLSEGRSRPRLARALLASGGLALLAGLWGGLLRLPWPLPPVHPSLAGAHGPLMVVGFLGVVISLERAVALGRLWGFAAPGLAGASGLLLAVGGPAVVAAALSLLSALVLLAIFVQLVRLRPEWAGFLLAAGAALLAVGNAAWLAGLPIAQAAPWWIGFLVLTIAGERLELAQLLLRSRATSALLVVCGLLVAGLFIALPARGPGLALAGVGLLGLAGWGALFDVARRTLHRPGLPRFIAICLLLGYAWLAVAGLLWLGAGERSWGGFWYDAMLHAVFVGFAFSMIFGHAPTILPAVSGLAVPFQRWFYLHLALLHGSLLLRVAGDLSTWLDGRRWGGLVNVAAVLLFVAATATAVLRARPAPAAGQGRR